MGVALYRKYRSKKLSEIVGQEHITTALSNALKSGKVSHAYLFTGPRGVGKTSIARILAHEINNLPYDENATHLDIIEIDAASNRRIDEIRELRERVHNAPAQAKYKVYIIDEVHMLTREAFNALLKTLEEPPAHAVFILATTEAHKLPETIVSRTQRYTFRPIDQKKAVEHLRSIAKTEKIDVTDDALELIAQHGEGSFRDSISLLDQVRNLDKKISLETVQGALGIAPEAAVRELLNKVAAHDAVAVLQTVQNMLLSGYHAPQIAKQLGASLRQELVAGKARRPAAEAGQLLRQLLEVSGAHDPQRLLEIILLEAALQGAPPAVSAPATTPEPTPKKAEPVKQTAPKPKAEQEDDGETVPAGGAKGGAPGARSASEHDGDVDLERQDPPALELTELNDESWQHVLQAIKARHNTLYSVARMAVPSFSGNEVTLAFSFPFHQKRLNEVKNRQVITDVVAQTTGQTVSIVCVVDPNARTQPAALQQPDVPDPSIEAISNIFGGGEVLE